ncbi:MAG: ABC transporter substrate-binding protein [Janthinobacterium lividum]
MTIARRSLTGGMLAGMALGGAARAQGPAQTPAPTRVTPFRIGDMSDMSGIVVDLSGPGSLVSMRMAVEDYGGKVLGRPIEVVVGDHLNKPDVGVPMAREWYDNGVRAIFDIGISTVALGVQSVAREKNGLVVFCASSSSDLTGSACSPNGISWAYDNYSQSQGSVRQLLRENGKTWFFLTVDYAYGRNVQRDTTAMVEAGGGKVIGSVLHPFETKDFSSYLLQAKASGADVIALATTTVHAGNLIKQADEFGIRGSRQRIAALSLTLHDVKALGLPAAQGLLITAPFYWDQNEQTRAFAKRYFERFRKMPNFIQASMYGAVTHYLKAVDKAGTDDTAQVVAMMKATPINDFMTVNGSIRDDGRTMRDNYVFRVKAPAESKGEWDLYTEVAKIPAVEAFAPADPKLCPLVKG